MENLHRNIERWLRRKTDVKGEVTAVSSQDDRPGEWFVKTDAGEIYTIRMDAAGRLAWERTATEGSVNG